jgi:hypothetical protein
MGAVRGYELYQQKVAQWEEERAEQIDSFSFQNVPVSLAAPQAEPMARPVLFNPKSAQEQEVFYEDVPLNPQEQTKQAQDTILSIVQDFNEQPEVQAFNKDLIQATQGTAVDLSALSGGDVAQVLKQNPEIAQIITKHMQNPEFAQTVQQIFSNPQFVESVRQLQRAQEPVQPKKTK